MNRIKTVCISAYAMVFLLFLAAIFYYGWNERKRSVREQDLFMESREGNRNAGTVPEEGGNTGNGVDKTENTADMSGKRNMNEEELIEEQRLPAAAIKKVTAGQDTLYRLEIYDTHTQEMVIQEGSIPPGFIGMTREELSEYWAEYTKEMPITEFEKGLLSCELTAFSSEQVTVRKTYDGSGLKYRYYMILEQGCVAIYYSDKKTVYEHTDILKEDLPEGEAQKLKAGVYGEDEERLYSILESYTS